MNMLLNMVDEFKQYGIRIVFYHIKKLVLRSDRNEWLYQSSLHKSKSLKELEKDLEKDFEQCNHYEMDFANPQTYCQKVYWLRLYGATPLKTKLADKYLCREYISEVIGDQYNVPLLGAWDSFDEIDFDRLPDQFVLKANHGCGFNYIVKDKNALDKSKAKKRIDEWMKINYALMFCEMQYYKIARKVFAEKYLEQLDGGLYDFKFHCVKGEPLFCELIGERNIRLGTGKQAVYDCEWNLLKFTFGDYDQFDHLIERPKCLDEMLEVARKLSVGIDYVRVDLYEIENRVYVGELTCTPSGGNNPNMTPKSADLELGQRIQLDAPYYLELEKE